MRAIGFFLAALIAVISGYGLAPEAAKDRLPPQVREMGDATLAHIFAAGDWARRHGRLAIEEARQRLGQAPPAGASEAGSDEGAAAPSVYAGQHLADADFSDKRLALAVFSGAQAQGARFNASLLDGADFASADLSESDFSNAGLAGASLDAAITRGARFRNADLTEASLRGADLTSADFTRAVADKARFGAANLQSAFFVGAQLQAAELIGANARGADFSHADLSDASLKGMSARGAKFTGAIVEGASFADVDLSGADLSRVHGLTQSQLNAACGDADTKLPGPEFELSACDASQTATR